LSAPDTNKVLLRLEVEPALKRATKVLAAAQGITMTELVSGLIVERLETQPTPSPTTDALQSR